MSSWDTRNTGPKPAHGLKAHKSEINAVSFAPDSEWLLLTGSGDNVGPLLVLARIWLTFRR
jgi:WD40 repeat protein